MFHSSAMVGCGMGNLMKIQNVSARKSSAPVPPPTTTAASDAAAPVPPPTTTAASDAAAPATAADAADAPVPPPTTAALATDAVEGETSSLVNHCFGIFEKSTSKKQKSKFTLFFLILRRNIYLKCSDPSTG